MLDGITNEEAILWLVSLAEHEGEEVLICAEDAKALQMGIEAIKALEPQPCEDCISREEVIDLVDELIRAISDEFNYRPRNRSSLAIMHDISNLPSVQPQPKIDEIIKQIEETRDKDKIAEYPYNRCIKIIREVLGDD